LRSKRYLDKILCRRCDPRSRSKETKEPLPSGERLLQCFIVLSVGRRLQPNQLDAADLFLPYSNPINPLPSSNSVAGSAAARGSA